MNLKLLIILFFSLYVCFSGLADFNNNLKSDLFIVQQSGSSTVLGWYENTGCLREIILKEHIALNDISVVAVGDFNGNSLTDLMIGTSGSNICRWYEFSADLQTLNHIASLELADRIVDISLGNFDNDEYGDMIVITASSACLWYEWVSGTDIILRGNLKKGGKAAAIGDLNNNGIPDVLLAYATGLQLMESTGNNTWALLPGCTWAWGATTNNIKSIAVGNVDDDSETLDFLYVYTKDAVNTGELMWRTYSVVDNAPVINWRAKFNGFADFESVRLGDVDGDGKNEIIASRSNGQVVFITAVEGKKLLELPFAVSIDSAASGNALAVSPSPLHIFPKPSAGKKDMVIIGGQGSAGWFQSGGISGQIDYLGQIVDKATSVTLGDFDNDDKLDLFVGKNGAEGTWYEANGTFGRFMPVQSIGSGTLPNGLAVGDFDGDGKGDLFNCVSWGNCYWYKSDADNTKRTVKTIANQALACALGNIDNDEHLDLLVSTAGGLRWFESTGTPEEHINRMIMPELAGALSMAIGDIDGDMYSDIFVVRQDAAVVWLEGRFDNQSPVFVGGVIASNASSVAIGDIDGDGMNELLITDNQGVIRWYRSLINDTVTQIHGRAFGVSAIDIAVNNSSLDYSFDCEAIEDDFNGDCYVDIDDLEIFSQRWLNEFLNDELYNYGLFSGFAGNWTNCSDPTNPSCVLTEKKEAFIHMDYADEVIWAGNLGYSTYREAEIAEFFIRCRDRGIDGVFWRITAGGKALHWSNVESVFPARIAPEFLTASDLELADIMANIDPLALAVQYAKLNGVKIFVWLRVSDENDADPQNPYAKASDIILDNPEYALLDRQGNPMIGTVCYNEPAVRAFKLAHISELVNNYDLDGVLLCTRTHAFYYNEDSGYQYGYNPPIVQEYQRLYGVNILTESFDYDKWLDIRAEGLNQFVEQASQIVHASGKKLWFGIKTANDEKRGWPYGEALQKWKSWLANEWIDGVVAGHYYTPAEHIESQANAFRDVADLDQTLIFLVQLYDFDKSLHTPLSDIETMIQSIASSKANGGSFFEALQLEEYIGSYWDPIYHKVDKYWHLNFD